MIPPTKQQILRLYKHLIRYGNQLVLTDKSYFLGRIRHEFRSNRELQDSAEIVFNFKVINKYATNVVKRYYVEDESFKKMQTQLSRLTTLSILNHQSLNTYLPILCRFKATLDYSRYPKLNEEDLEETFTRGSGPGGQAVNKTSNCVLLRHLPTNIIVKCHTHRIASRNREEARRLLLEKLDAHYNAENSIAAQKKDFETRKSVEKKRRQHKSMELKKMWKEREQKEFD